MKASCLCGGIQMEMKAPFISASHCHCRLCRKEHGALSAAYGVLLKADLEWISGKKRVKKFASSEKGRRGFCKDCGSTLYFYHKDHPNHIEIPLGILDCEPSTTPQYHIFVESKPSWHAIHDDLPQYANSH